jgi:hypothetical protein
MSNSDLLKEAIADARAVKETAIANAKLALEEARQHAFELCEKDPTLQLPENAMIRRFLISQKSKIGWGKIA